ncbi:uncharacterized protein LOC125013728 [Mugil cephalus]|uniref:uncharacterized protein LOC125013728 n=1 Tax=Mugil cephalus TaxID=48193 RepID=UPI001FB59546|nr:uncharacterized protein LOC125013728 [Mugil cephalus]
MQNQNPKRTGPAQRPVLPQVRYHPSIQTTGGGVTSTNRTQRIQNQDTTNRTTPAARPDPDPPQNPKRAPPRPKPDPQEVQNQDTNNRTTPAARPDPDGGQRPEPVPVGLGVQMDRGLVEDVEVLTRGQRTNPDWFAWRKNRITASVAHSIAHCKFVNGRSLTPPSSYLAAVTGEGPRVQTRAMSWGVEMEAEAVRRYQALKTSALGRPVSVLDCGLFIDPRRPWLAASPDGIVVDHRTGRRLLCLEVKCPYKHRHRRVEDACREDKAFCLQIQDQDGHQDGQPPSYRLKTSHSYFTQIQCQLAVTGLEKADLVVFTLEETAVVPVDFDPELWEETVSKLEVFYRDAVLPRVKQRTRETSAAWTPEQ